MYFSFLVNNFHFAFELFGALVFLMAGWLSFDAYTAQKEATTFFRFAGFGVGSISLVIHALNFDSDVMSYLASFLYIIAILLILISFFQIKKLEVSAILVIPAFSMWNPSLSGVSFLLFSIVSYLSFRQFKKEFNRTWIPLSIAFAFLSADSLLETFNTNSQVSIFFVSAHLLKIIGIGFLARWVWQYLSLRIRESAILIFISTALFLSTVVTLAFSTILISRIASETEASLLTDGKVFDLTIQSLKEESSAKARVMAQNTDLISALSKNDTASLERVLEGLLEDEKVGFITVADNNGDVVLRAHALTKRGDSIAGERVFEEASGGNNFVTVEDDAVERLSIRAGSQIFENNKPLGVIITGYPLDYAMVDGIKKVTGLEMLVYDTTKSVAGTALARDGRTRIVGLDIPNEKIKADVLTNGGLETARIDMYGQSFLSSFLPLYNGDGKIIGMISAAKSEQNILDIANATNRLTLITIIITMLILTWPIYLLTNRITSGGL
jgi:hypothetical protein